MKIHWSIVFLVVGMWFLASMLLLPRAWAEPLASPIEQGTPEGPRVEPYDAVNVRAGPNTDYDLVGRLVAGQTAPIVGKVTVGQFVWLKIVYFGGPDNFGWVYSGTEVRVVGDLASVPEITEIPPTPTLPPTATLELGVPVTVTPNPVANRLPTFTPPALVVRPTLLPAEGVSTSGSFPPALAIILLFVTGLFVGVVGLLRSRG